MPMSPEERARRIAELEAEKKIYQKRRAAELEAEPMGGMAKAPDTQVVLPPARPSAPKAAQPAKKSQSGGLLGGAIGAIRERHKRLQQY